MARCHCHARTRPHFGSVPGRTQELGGADRAETGLVHERWVKLADKSCDLAPVLAGLCVELASASGQVTQYGQHRLLVQLRAGPVSHPRQPLSESGTVAAADSLAQCRRRRHVQPL